MGVGHLTSKFLQDYGHALAPQGPVPLKKQLTVNGLEMAKIACHFCSYRHFSTVSEQSLYKFKLKNKGDDSDVFPLHRWELYANIRKLGNKLQALFF